MQYSQAALFNESISDTGGLHKRLWRLMSRRLLRPIVSLVDQFISNEQATPRLCSKLNL